LFSSVNADKKNNDNVTIQFVRSSLQESSPEEVFVITFHAVYGRIYDLDIRATLIDDALADALDGLLAGFGITHDSSLTYIVATSFELRLDQDDSRSMPVLPRLAERSQHRRDNERRGDEGDVHRKEGWNRTLGWKQFAGSEKTGIGALSEGNARIVAKLLGDLSVASIDSKNHCGSALKHAISEASRGSSNINAGETGDVDRPVGERVLEFESTAAHIFAAHRQERGQPE
jgi:hypothetical protein